MADPEPPRPDKSWWTTLPGLLTAVAGIITALGGLVAVLAQHGLLGGAPAAAGTSPAGTPATAAPSSAGPAAPPAPPAVAAAPVPTTAPAATLKSVRVTAKDGSVVSLKASSDLTGTGLPLQSGQEIAFDRLERVDIGQPWDGSVTLTLVGGSRLDATALNLPVSGSNELGPYLAMLSDIRRIEFIR